jgi:hypothetical protein
VRVFFAAALAGAEEERAADFAAGFAADLFAAAWAGCVLASDLTRVVEVLASLRAAVFLGRVDAIKSLQLDYQMQPGAERLFLVRLFWG